MSSTLQKGGYLLGLLLAGTAGWYLSEYQSNAKAEPAHSENYLATVNGEGLEVDWFVEQMKIRGGLQPGQYQTTEQKKTLLDYLINEEITSSGTRFG